MGWIYISISILQQYSRRNLRMDKWLYPTLYWVCDYLSKLGGWPPGPRFNIKMTSYQYRKSHCGDKTILRPSYLHNGISYTGKMTSLYWIRAQGDVVHWSSCSRMTDLFTHRTCTNSDSTSGVSLLLMHGNGVFLLVFSKSFTSRLRHSINLPSEPPWQIHEFVHQCCH